MDSEPHGLSRRSALGVFGAAAAATAIWSTSGTAEAAPANSGPEHHDPKAGKVQLLINGSPAKPGSYAFPTEVDSVVLDNGLIRFTFGRDDAAGGIVTGWTDVSITASSVVVDGVELAHNLNGVEPRDPDRQHSFYIDAGGGKSRLVCSEVRVLRCTPDLVEVAFVDTTSTVLRHEHHLIMRRGRRGLYGYDILTAVSATTINEVRMNARWDRGIFDHSYNWERGKGQQPTYAYLATQTSVGDETWRIDGINNPDLPSPGSNAGNLPAGTVYTKYNWSIYHHENPMFGHYGNGFGAWLTPLGGVTDQTLCAFYGAGPNHQDLAIHQDALILNYFGINHYGEVGYPLPAGYQRMYGPWYTYVTVGDPDDPDAMIADAAAIARAEIAENRAGSAWIDDPLYPSPARRATVTGRVRLTDGRPADGMWVLLSTQDVTDVFTIHEPTYFVKTDADGNFSLPGIPPAFAPGTTSPGTYTLYVFAGKGSVTDQYKQTGITVSGRRHHLGDIVWAPTARSTFLWQIGRADRTGGEYALATNPADHANPRSYEKPSQIPGNLNFVIGSSWEPRDWYYAQTNAGTWTVTFDLDRAYTGTAYLTVSTSMQSGGAPTVAVNGATDVVTGTLPPNNDSAIARQADRSGYPRLATLSFPADRLVAGTNTVTLTKGAAGSGTGWDTLILEVDEATAPRPAKLAASVVRMTDQPGGSTWTIKITNRGKGAANDVRVAAVAVDEHGRSPDGTTVTVAGRDPNVFPVPVVGGIPSGGSVTVDVAFGVSRSTRSAASDVDIHLSANGGRARTTLSSRLHR